MDLDNLAAFVEVAKQHSFSKAAHSLFLSQPAVSKRIGKLEYDLNTKLFDRIGKSVSLTEAGKVLLTPATQMLAARKEMLDMISTLSERVDGTLVMATSHHIGLHRLSPVLRQFTHAYPEVNLDIRFMDSEQACALVAEGELEIAVVTLPKQTAPFVTTETIWQDDMCFVVHPEHPLAEKGEAPLEVLAKYPAVLPATGTYTRSILERALAQHEISLAISMSTNYLETLKMLVATGIGWSLIPKIMVDDSICVVRTGLELSRDLGLVSHTKKTLSNAAKVMMQMIQG